MHAGVIGVGRIGTFHAQALAAHEGVDAVTLTDVDAGRAEQVAEELGARMVPTIEALLERVDAVVITASTSEHSALIEAAVEAGLPTFCEKPIALDLESTREIVERVERAGALVQMGFQRRFDPGYRRARNAVRDGSAGRLYVLRMAGHDPYPPHESYIPGSGGIFRDLHIHDFDIARYVTGQEVTEVYVDGDVLGFDFFRDHEDVDTAVGVLRFSGGTLGIMSGTRHDPLGYDIRMEVFGSEDSFVVGWDDRTPLRSIEPNGPSAPDEPYTSFLDRFADAYRAELAAFVDVVAGRRDNPCTPRDALAAMQVAVACDLSRAEHRPVRVADVR